MLKVQSTICYYFSKVIFLIVIGVLVDIICVIVPVIQNFFNHKELFIRPLTGYDLLNAFILLNACSFTGGAMGSVLHPRVMQNRKWAILLTVLLSILTVIKIALLKEVLLFKIVAWIFLPLNKISVVYGQAGVFQLEKTIICFKRKF